MKKIIGLLLLLTIILTGCVNNDRVSYTILFERNNDSDFGVSIVELGSYLEEPSNPVKEDHAFVGWYSDIELENIYVFGTAVTKDFTLYAKYLLIEEEEELDLSTLPYFEYLSDTNPVIIIEVENFGTMILELFPSVAPNTVNNFIMYIENGDFSGNNFHRVIEGFMIQGGNTYSTDCPITGDFSSNGVVNDLSHFRGTISMARTSVMDSATSQFFIVHENSFFLDGNYATFGGLIDGFNILDSIATVDTFYTDAPVSTVTITSITVELNGYVAASPVCAD